MLEWIRSFFSGVTVYLIPLVPMGILLWYSEHRSNRTLARFGTVQTGYAAREMVKMMLQKKSMTVPIERSDDYSQNAYLPLEDKIMLSPNTCDQKDVTSLGLAARAAGKAIFAKTSPEMAKVLDTMDHLTQIFFWVVFTVLAFGFMGGSALTVLVGYCLLGMMLIFFFIEKKLEANINRSIIELLEGIVPKDLLADVKKVLRADSRRF
ncbi:MAG: zinc metallopeptidase [Thermoguttaceae bacterium]|nr:zinc metallopeptidase [Thermoguttaceae bacterium]